MSSSALASRKAKCHPPPPPAPKILQLPRRILQRRPVPAQAGPVRNLRSLLKEENTAINGVDLAFEWKENRWKAESQKLRNFLRSERDSALGKLAKSRERKKIDGSDGVEKKMGKLNVRSRGADEEEKEIGETKGSSSLAKHKQHEINVEMLKRKMEGLSKGMQESRKYQSQNLRQSQNQKETIGCEQEVAEMANQRQVNIVAGEMGHRCCCKCKEIVGRIAEEVKAESEQWTEMQELLDQVRLEMEELRSSRDLWQRRAIDSELNLRSLYSHMLEWRQKARASEQKVSELQKHIFQLEESSQNNANSTSDENWNPVRLPRIKCQQAPESSPDYYSAMEKEKHVLVCRLNSTTTTTTTTSKSNFRSRRSPLREIGNFSAT